MASYVVTGSYRTVQVLSPTQVLDAEYVVCSTVPHGLGFAYTVPEDSWLGGQAGGLLDTIATQLEEMTSGGVVVASTPVQDIDPSGLLTDSVDVTVGYVQPNTSLPELFGGVTIPIQAFFNQDTGIGGLHIGKSPMSYVTDEYDRLAQLSAGA